MVLEFSTLKSPRIISCSILTNRSLDPCLKFGYDFLKGVKLDLQEQDRSHFFNFNFNSMFSTEQFGMYPLESFESLNV